MIISITHAVCMLWIGKETWCINYFKHHHSLDVEPWQKSHPFRAVNAYWVGQLMG
jgi:hypothetical protein